MKRRLANVVGVCLIVAACGGGVRAGAVTVDLQEFSIDASATALITGDVELEVENHGEYPHTLVVSDSDGAVLAATDVLQPSETARLSLDLEPGAYEFTCRIVGTDDAGRVVDHYQAGMHRTVSSA